MLALLALSQALAADEADLSPQPAEQDTDQHAKGGGGKGGGGKGKGGSAKEKKGWQTEPFTQVSAGASIAGSDTAEAAVSVTGQAGYLYYYSGIGYPRPKGQTRVAATYVVPANGNQGIDLRGGSFIGPQWKKFNLSIGPDLFYNQLVLANLELDPTIGVQVPLMANYALPLVGLGFGLGPSWLANSDRRVDWDTVDSALPGFGHEFTYMASAGFSIDNVRVGLSYQYVITAGGVQQGFNLGAQLSDILGMIGGDSGSGGDGGNSGGGGKKK